MKKIFINSIITAISALCFWSCSQEPYDWSQEGPTMIEVAETTFPTIERNSIKVETFINVTAGAKISKVKYTLLDMTQTIIEEKEGTPVEDKNGYFTIEFTELQTNSTYLIQVKAYSSSSSEPLYSDELYVTTASDFTLITGDANSITQTSAKVYGEFHSEVIEPSAGTLGIIYGVKNDLQSNYYEIVNYTSIDGNFFTVELTGLEAARKYYYCTCFLRDGVKYYGDIREFTTEMPDGAVDLGLSVLWAECNLGANSPEETGNYYAWGELSPKETYNFDSYQYCDDGLSFDKNWWYDTYWQGLGTYGINIHLEKDYDAAYNQLGDRWGIPTSFYMDELIENCDMVETTINDIKGVKFTSKKNGNSIFLPLAGYKDDQPDKTTKSTIKEENTQGCYWSSNGVSSPTSNAYSLTIPYGVSEKESEIRYRGLNIRPVFYKNVKIQ